MKLRISGTREECAAAVGAIATVLTVREVSGFYPNRGASVLGRVYLDADGSAGAVRASADRADRGTPPDLPELGTADHEVDDEHGAGGERS